MTANFNNEDETSAVPILIPGTKIKQYEIKHKIGAGGMGEVYLVEDTLLDRKAALKFLPSQYSKDEELRARFTREAKTAAQLNHQNVITIYEIGEHDGRLFIALEYIDGDSLDDYIKRKQLTVQKSIEYLAQICAGLEAAHDIGLIHRDIKPANIMIDKSNRLRILDFGLAKFQGDNNLTQDGTAIGTVNYMSPEQSEGKDTDRRGDIFSLGVVFYEMLTGERPFDKKNIPATLFAIVNEEHPDVCEKNKDVPPEIKQVLDKMLAKKPEDRFQTFKETQEMLQGFISPTTGTVRVSVTPQQTVESLAVLYLRNLGSPDDDFLSYGITEDLIIDLTRIGTVRVSPMRSIMKYKDSDDELEVIAEKLKVNKVLDGSIMKMGNMLRVSAQLIDVQSGEHLWADRWEQPFEKLPEIKHNLANGINQTLQVGTTIFREAQVGVPEAEDAQAYELYLRGKHTFSQRKERSDIDIALGLYRQALKLEPSLLSAKVGVAEVLMHLSDFVQAERELQSALVEAKERDLKPDQQNILCLLARYYITHSNWKEACRCTTEALEIANTLKDVAGEAEILGIRIRILQLQSKFDEALQLFDRVLEITRHLEDHEKTAEALKNMGVAYARKGDYDRAESLYLEALELAKEHEDLVLQAACKSNIGNLYFFRGELDKTFEYYNKAYEIYNKLDDKAGAARQKLNMGLLQIQQGNMVGGVQQLKSSASIFKELGDRSNYAHTLINLSQAQLATGDEKESFKSAKEALQIGKEIDQPLIQAHANYRLGLTEFHNRNLHEAEEYICESLQIAQDAKATRNVIYSLLSLARLDWYKENWKETERSTKEALSLAKDIGEKSCIEYAQMILAGLSCREGLYNSAIRQLQQIEKKELVKNNHELDIICRTLIGELMLTYGRTEVDKSDGFLILEKCLADAHDKTLAFEIKILEELIQKFSGWEKG